MLMHHEQVSLRGTNFEGGFGEGFYQNPYTPIFGRMFQLIKISISTQSYKCVKVYGSPKPKVPPKISSKGKSF